MAPPHVVTPKWVPYISIPGIAQAMAHEDIIGDSRVRPHKISDQWPIESTCITRQSLETKA
jgi:hypothetical protein